jgi:hypothetical protein
LIDGGGVSLGIIVKGSEGIVLAADSRLTLGATIVTSNPQSPQIPQPQQIFVNFDNATKLLSFGPPNQWIGAVTYGDAVIGTKPTDLRTAQSFVPEFEAKLDPKKRLTVEEFSRQLGQFFMEQWKDRGMPDAVTYRGSGMTFAIGGYDEGKPYGSVYVVEVPRKPDPVEQSPNSFGITFGGQGENSIRLIQGYDPRFLDITKKMFNLSDQQIGQLRASLAPLMLGIPYGLLPLQDCIDLAIFLIHTTVSAQKLSLGIRGVGGSIDVAVITRRGELCFIQRKELIGEGK